MLSTLVPAIVVGVAFLGFFLWFRSKQKRIYQPRTFMGNFTQEEKTPRTKDTMFGWIKDFLSTPDEYVLSHHSLDGYLYLRFFKILVIIAGVGIIVTWPVLFPVYATGGSGKEQFNILTFGNVEDANRFYATVFISWIYLGKYFAYPQVEVC